MPDSAPEGYNNKKLADDADPDKRPDAQELYFDIYDLMGKDNSDDNTWKSA